MIYNLKPKRTKCKPTQGGKATVYELMSKMAKPKPPLFCILDATPSLPKERHPLLLKILARQKLSLAKKPKGNFCLSFSLLLTHQWPNFSLFSCCPKAKLKNKTLLHFLLSLQTKTSKPLLLSPSTA